jgi:hypothetical protein
MTTSVPATELFNDAELLIIEQIVTHLPPNRPLYGLHREYPRFIDLPADLEEKAKLPYKGVRRVEYDVDAENVLLYF